MRFFASIIAIMICRGFLYICMIEANPIISTLSFVILIWSSSICKSSIGRVWSSSWYWLFLVLDQRLSFKVLNLMRKVS